MAAAIPAGPAPITMMEGSFLKQKMVEMQANKMLKTSFVFISAQKEFLMCPARLSNYDMIKFSVQRSPLSIK